MSNDTQKAFFGVADGSVVITSLITRIIRAYICAAAILFSIGMLNQQMRMGIDATGALNYMKMDFPDYERSGELQAVVERHI